ncbi:MAG: sulfatase, partial [Planctomycetaceae bacterium]|nr:sulfatase [Planctomycetaceae bacterium]
MFWSARLANLITNKSRFGLILFFGLALGSVGHLALAKDQKPNILLIVVDDLGYGELGCQGNSQIPTPNIDSLAKNGVRLTSGYVTASYCSPSRAGLLTGRYQTRFGHELNPVGRYNLHPKAGLPESERTIADQLKSAGYATGMVGKWHLGGTESAHPLNRGFDEFYGFLHEGHFFVPPPYEGVLSFLRKKQLPEGANTRWRDGNIVYTDHMGNNEPPYDEHNPVLRGREPLVEATYLTDAFTREALTFLEKPREKPFFLYLAYNAVHSPLQARFEDMQAFEDLDVHRRVFAGMLSNLDQNIGKILKTLKQQQLEENTLIVFLSDNGGPTKELTSSNRPLRGGKGNLYEGGIRVPFLLQWKGHLPAGKEYDHPIISTDIFATASALSGVPVPEGKPMDGVNLIPYLTGQTLGKPHNTLYWRMRNKTALRQGNWKIVRNPGGGQSSKEFELYNLQEDLEESANLATTHPEKLQELSAVWKKLDHQMIDPIWQPDR